MCPSPCRRLLLLLAFISSVAALPAGAAERATFVYAGVEDYLPFEGRNKLHEPVGFNVELIRAIAEVSGFDVEIQLMPWAEVERKLQSGDVHIAAMLGSPTRRFLYELASAHHAVQTGIFVREGTDTINRTADLNGKHVGVLKRGLMHQSLLRTTPHALLVATDSVAEGFELLSAGQVDAVIAIQATGHESLASSKLADVKLAALLEQPYGYHFATAQGSHELLDLIDRGLGQLKQNGRFRELREKWLEGGLRAQQKRNSLLVYMLTGFTLLMLVAMSLWNGFLRRRIAEQTAELERRASHDALTGLPNRALLQDRLEQALAHSERAQSRVAVLFLDLDGFKPVNDNLGHAAGDELLKGVAVRLQECVRKGDTVARLGGDEFVLVLQGTSEAEAQVIADRVLQALRQPVQLSGQEVRLAGSLGVSLTSDQALDADTLLQHADMAMYRAKQNGRNNCQFYNEAMAQTRQDPPTAPPL